MLQSHKAKLKQYSTKQASPPRPEEGAPAPAPAAAMLQAFLRDLQQQRRPTTQVRRNQATETRGDVPGPRLAALLRGTSGAGGDRGKITPPVGTTMIKAQVPPKDAVDSSSMDTGSSPRPLAGSRSPLLLPQPRRIREPSERLLTLAQPRRPVEPPGPIRTQLSLAEDKQVVALERIRQRQSLAEAAHYQRSGSENSSAVAVGAANPGLTQARLSQVSSPLGAKGSTRMRASRSGLDRDRRSVVGSVQGTEASHGSARWSPRVALKPRRTATGPNWLPYSKRRLREPSQRILALAQPRKSPQPPEDVSDAKKKKKVSESGSEVASVLADKTATPEERVRVRQSKAEAAHFSRATERAKLASRWRHAKEEKAAREAAAKAKAKSYLGRASSFAAARQATQKALSSTGSDRR